MFRQTGQKNFCGLKNYALFREIITEDAFRRLFHRETFGGEGFEGYELLPVLISALEIAGIEATATLKEDRSIHWVHPDQNKYMRKGIENAFAPAANKLLGLACVFEDEKDKLGHWVVLAGSRYTQTKPADYIRIVLD
jgi:hypothetical protein